MRIFVLSSAEGREITEFGSRGVTISPVAKMAAESKIASLNFSPGGTLGFHPAVGVQIFIVTQGKGWVMNENQDRFPIRAGQVVIWQSGEFHASGSDEGMTAVVMEGEKIENY